MPSAVEGGARPVEVHALERSRKAIRIALAPDLAVRDDVDPGALEVSDGDDGGIVLGLLELLWCHPPDLRRARSWGQPASQHHAIDEPVGLRIAPDNGRQQDMGHRHHANPSVPRLRFAHLRGLGCRGAFGAEAGVRGPGAV